MSFSPKNPFSMILTFVLVLVFTMIKEGYEDYQRYKQDKDMNNKLTKVLNHSTMQWETKKWMVLAPGDIVRIECDSEAPADICLLHTSNKSGIVFVDTMNLDGETSLKEKIVPHEYLDDRKLSFMQGELICDPPNENLERWSGQMTYRSNIFKSHPTCIRNTFLRGCFLRNTDYIIGLVVYTGMETKIMKNLKKPLHKVSNIMRLMNNMLYSVFAF
jgi:phospholipid-transporting ATPase